MQNKHVFSTAYILLYGMIGHYCDNLIAVLDQSYSQHIFVPEKLMILEGKQSA